MGGHIDPFLGGISLSTSLNLTSHEQTKVFLNPQTHLLITKSVSTLAPLDFSRENGSKETLCVMVNVTDYLSLPYLKPAINCLQSLPWERRSNRFLQVVKVIALLMSDIFLLPTQNYCLLPPFMCIDDTIHHFNMSPLSIVLSLPLAPFRSIIKPTLSLGIEELYYPVYSMRVM